MLMVSGAEEREQTPAFLYVYVEDADSAYRRALEGGATSIEESSDLPYGDRRAMVRDRWGNTWQIANTWWSLHAIAVRWNDLIICRADDGRP